MCLYNKLASHQYWLLVYARCIYQLHALWVHHDNVVHHAYSQGTYASHIPKYDARPFPIFIFNLWLVVLSQILITSDTQQPVHCRVLHHNMDTGWCVYGKWGTKRSPSLQCVMVNTFRGLWICPSGTASKVPSLVLYPGVLQRPLAAGWH